MLARTRRCASKGPRLGLAALTAVGPLAIPPRPQAATLEYAVKAAYLLKFTPFIEWPVSAFAAPSSPFYVCVSGDDPFGADLDQALVGRSVGAHPVKVRRLQSLDSAS